uniref:DUF3108 domain-containing protein n=1 Tax=Eiseniibacteriota bacterium TaxID=2212470 RepID=A0A832MLA0_UNCEI
MSERRGLARAALAAALLAGACGPSAGSVPAPANPLMLPLWDDGRAELSVYEGVVPRYGHDRPAKVTLVVVKEDLLEDTLVKSEAGPRPGRTVEAVKMHWVWQFSTGTYDYHQAATVMFRRADGVALKETMSSAEGCGITFVRVAPRGGRLVHAAHSYWEGEADREVEVPRRAGQELLFLDGAPVWLRRWAGAARPFETRVRLLPGQISARSPAAAARPVDAVLRYLGEEDLAVPAGRFRARRFAIAVGGATHLYWLDARAPHVLLRMQGADGRGMALAATRRLDYWNHTAPGDERRLWRP